MAHIGYDAGGLVAVYGRTRRGDLRLAFRRKADGQLSGGQPGVTVFQGLRGTFLRNVRSGLVKVGSQRVTMGRDPLAKVGAFLDMTNDPTLLIRDNIRQLSAVFAEAGIPFRVERTRTLRALHQAKGLWQALATAMLLRNPFTFARSSSPR